MIAYALAEPSVQALLMVSLLCCVVAQIHQWIVNLLSEWRILR